MANEDELQQRLDKVYQSRIAPQVPALEGARRQRLRSAYIRYLSCIGAIALITVAVYLLGWWSSHTAIVVDGARRRNLLLGDKARGAAAQRDSQLGDRSDL